MKLYQKNNNSIKNKDLKIFVKRGNMKIAVLLTCFNRQKISINCLENLYKQNMPHGYELDVYLAKNIAVNGRNFVE